MRCSPTGRTATSTPGWLNTWPWDVSSISVATPWPLPPWPEEKHADEHFDLRERWRRCRAQCRHDRRAAARDLLAGRRPLQPAGTAAALRRCDGVLEFRHHQACELGCDAAAVRR